MWRSLAGTATAAFALVNPTLGVAQEGPASKKSVPEQVVDAFYRYKARQVLATVTRLLGDFDDFKAALHDAFAHSDRATGTS